MSRLKLITELKNMEPLNLTNQQYKFCCELIWGGVPFAFTKGNIQITKEDNMETAIFREKALEILKMYPQLDKSFYEKHCSKSL